MLIANIFIESITLVSFKNIKAIFLEKANNIIEAVIPNTPHIVDA